MELWDFTPVVAHGDLHEDNLLVDRGRVVTVTGWTDLHIGDPADDFSWLASSGDQEFTDAVVKAYWQHRTGGTVADEHLMRRAALAAEFALAQWLVRGVANDDEDMAAEAEAMLLELRDDVEDHGGQEISLAPPGPRAVTTPAAAAAAAAAPGAGESRTEPPTSESPASEPPGSVAAGSTAQQPDEPEWDDVDDEDGEDGAVITDRDTEDAAEVETEPEDSQDEDGGEAGEPQTSGSHLAGEPPTTALELDEVRQLRIDRGADSSS
jgi:macrolide phosphotransferase